MSLTDYAALSPLLLLLGGALLVLMLHRGCFLVAAATFVLALIAALYAPSSHNPLLTPWLNFDALSRFFTLFFLSIGLTASFLADAFFKRFSTSQGEYYFLLLSSVFGLILIGSSADFLTLFLGLETLSVALYVLCGYMKKWTLSHESAMKYFLLGALGAAFLLYGIALLYGATGTTRFAEVQGASALFLSGIALVTLGFAFKAAIVPFHVWAPDVYDGAPTPVTAFMAVGTKVGAFAAFTRLFLIGLPSIWNEAISILAIVTLVYANFVAIRQEQLRRFFAYSGISHAGFLLLPLVGGGPDAIPALLFYLVIYAFATLGSFAILAYLDDKEEGVLLSDLNGLFYRSPYLATVFALCLLTLAGIPPTAGFFAKLYVLKVVFAGGYTALGIVALLTTILSAYYYLRIVAIMLKPAEAKQVPALWPAGFVAAGSFAALVMYMFYPMI